jgi:FkbM family methyltransferase
MLSYAQRYEDLHLLRCFPTQSTGFYIDIGAGHPVYDNVSFAFYLRGWNGITVEPNPWLATLSAAVRPRDRRIQSLVGSAPGEATYYLVEDFHGLSTTVASHAEAARKEYGKAARPLSVPVATLAALCVEHAPAVVDFLKIDVEGAERDVLAGNDWQRFRPKVVVVEALAPVTLAPAWATWEPLLTEQSYRFAFFDGLNRYYVADEHGQLGPLLATAPPSFEGMTQMRSLGPALRDESHPDHRLARMLSGTDPVRLPLLGSEEMLARLTGGLAADELARPAAPSDIAAVAQRLLGSAPAVATDLHRNATIRDVYSRLIDTDEFRAACGRISASYAW